MLTLGLAYPFAQARLERFKMRHTHYGDLPGRFEGIRLPACSCAAADVAPGDGPVRRRASSIALAHRRMGQGARGGAAGSSVDELHQPARGRLSGGLCRGRRGARRGRGQRGDGGAAVSGLPGHGAALVAVRPAVRRAHRHAPICAPAQIYGAYLRFLWYASLFTLAAGLSSAPSRSWRSARWSSRSAAPSLANSLGAAGRVAYYVVIMLGFSTIYQATVKLALWRCGVELIELAGLRRSTASRPAARRVRRSAKASPTHSTWAGSERVIWRSGTGLLFRRHDQRAPRGRRSRPRPTALRMHGADGALLAEWPYGELQAMSAPDDRAAARPRQQPGAGPARNPRSGAGRRDRRPRRHGSTAPARPSGAPASA